jgi:hypothetical protein
MPSAKSAAISGENARIHGTERDKEEIFSGAS